MDYQHIRLQEAMTAELSQGSLGVWETDGLHVIDDKLPKNANVINTFVMKSRNDSKIRIGIELTVEGEMHTYMRLIDEVSKVEELKDKFPELFKLNGIWHTFG